MPGTEAQALSQTLASCGVPAYAQSSGGYFDAVEVHDTSETCSRCDRQPQAGRAADLRALLHHRRLYLRGARAHSRAAHQNGPFYEAFFACAEGEDALSLRARSFLTRLSRYRAESRLVTLEELIGKLLDETGFYEEMGAGISGEQRQANLNALLEKAHAFESAGSRGVWGFLRHLALAEDNATVGAAQTVTADVVRILTIHKSKGLEFPVVFVGGLGKPFNRTDVNDSLQMHAVYGMALRFIDREGTLRLKRDTLSRAILSQRVKREQLAEEMRVLYVAMTRARRKLILTACLGKPEEKLASSPRTPTAWQVLKCGSPVRWLLMGMHRHLTVNILEREDYLGGQVLREEHALPKFDPVVLDQIESRLGWQYAHAEAARVAAKAAVSRVVRGEERLPEFSRPAFLGTKADAVFAGTATHAAMQYLPLADAMDVQTVSAYLDSLAENGRITPEQAVAADAESIAWFTRVPLFTRMRAAERMERELPFSYPMDAEQLYGIAAEERVLLQGVLDACYYENGAWTIVDYKTDHVRPGENAQQAAARHAQQLRLYALALEALTGQRVKEAFVVLLSYRAVEQVL